MCLCILIYAITILVMARKKHTQLDFHMQASLICIVLNVILQISAYTLDIYDLEKMWQYKKDVYPGSEAINISAASCVALYNMQLFNSFLFDIYKWGVFIISTNQRLTQPEEFEEGQKKIKYLMVGAQVIVSLAFVAIVFGFIFSH